MGVDSLGYRTACDELRKLVPKGSTVYGIVRTVARSGLSRTIDFYAFQDNKPVYLSGYFSKILNVPRTKEGALKVRGTGMDVIFACVYEVSRSVYGVADALKRDSL